MLEPGGSEEMLANGGTISYTQGAVDLMGLLGRFIYGSTDSGGQTPAPEAASTPEAAPAAPEATP
jgi:phospholipid/cholesterol/gamma-HCH transport system substrate-binding protein